MAISTAISQSARAAVVGIGVNFKNLRNGTTVLPQRVAVIGQGATASTYPATKQQITSAVEAGTLYGFGSPVHLAAQQLLPSNGDGIGSIPLTVYPLVDDVSGVVASGDITPTTTQTVTASYTVVVNEIVSAPFVIAVGATVAQVVTSMTAAINAIIDMPIIAVDGVTKVTFTSKWKGVNANDILVRIDGSLTAGTTFAFTQAAGGLVNPDVDTALALIGNVWETLVINCMEIADTTTLNKYQTFGDGRWGALVNKPLLVFTGNNNSDSATVTTITDARKSDKVNVQLVGVGSDNLPLVVAARQVARIAVIVDSNPPQNYGSQNVSGVVPGTDGEQWDYVKRDAVFKKGSSTVIKRDGVMFMKDTVTMYHPSGDPTPAYQYVVDIMKLMTIIHNTDLIFETSEWDGAPLIPDNQATVNPTAKQPKMAVAALAGMIDGLGLDAVLSDPDTAKKSIVAGINGSNPKRLDISYTVQLSGNSEIISIDLNFGFFFG